MITTRAAVLRERSTDLPYQDSRPLSIEEVNLELPKAGELLVKIKAAGLCHSDLSVINGERPRPLPMVLGHEASGEVILVGESVTEINVGDHVILTLPSCGSCPQCINNRSVLCDKGIKANTEGTLLKGSLHLTDTEGNKIYHHLGISAFAEHAVVSKNSVIPIPKDIPFEIAAVFGCSVITGVGAIMNRVYPKKEDSVMILGLGGIGLAALMAVKACGVDTIIAIDNNPEKLEVAKELGATHVILMDEQTFDNLRVICPEGVAIAADFTGAEKALEFAFAVTKRGGKTLSAGLPRSDAKIMISPTQLVAEERELIGSYLGSGLPKKDIRTYVEMYQQGLLPVEKLITHRIEFEEINLGFDRLAKGQAIRQIITF